MTEMDELLKKAAELRGMPESLVERSAQARAKKEGIPVEQVLAEWAGVDPSTVAAAAPAAEPAQEPAATGADEPEAEAEPESVAEEPGPEEPAEAVPAEEEPKVEVLKPAETDDEGELVPEPAAAQTRSRYPVWLAATFVFIPLLAVLYIMTVPNGPHCGSAGQLAIDPVTGVAVNCDGTPYGLDVVNNFTAGEALFVANCSVCHGAGGGGGSGPALAGGSVLVTFPQGACTDHRTWVTLGTAGWGAEIGNTYGANGKTVGGFGVMPGFGSGAQALSEVEIAQVAIYERVAFGEQDLAAAEADCLPADDGEGTALGS